MDASVFCSAFGNEKLQARWNRIMRSEFMVFRYFRRGEKAPVGLSNWFIKTSSCSSSCEPGMLMVMVVRDHSLTTFSKMKLEVWLINYEKSFI